MDSNTLAVMEALPQLKSTIGQICSIEIADAAEFLLGEKSVAGEKCFVLINQQGEKISIVGWADNTPQLSPDFFNSGRFDGVAEIPNEDVANAYIRLPPSSRREAHFVVGVGKGGVVTLYRPPAGGRREGEGVFEHLLRGVRKGVLENLGLMLEEPEVK